MIKPEQISHKRIPLLLLALALSYINQSCSPGNQHNNSGSTAAVKIIGAMRNVLWKGELSGMIDLDTIQNKTHLYGIGPVEYLSGEILIMDGIAYQSSVATDTTMIVKETTDMKAPFFAYATIARWHEMWLPDSIQNDKQLESYLLQATTEMPKPFLFKLSGVVEKAIIHVVNLPPGNTVSSPEEAHQGLRKYTITNQPAEVLGFFSTQHKTIFTHHDTFLHMHLITADNQKMGHVEYLRYKTGTLKLQLPVTPD